MDLTELVSFENNAKDYTRRQEGYNPNVYNDTKNIATTGYGFNLKEPHVRRLLPKDVLSGERPLTQIESDVAYDILYNIAAQDARDFIGQKTFAGLPNNAKQALVDVSYNIGGTKLRKFENMREALINGDMKTAREELLNSKYKDDVPNRALRNADLIFQSSEGLSNLSTTLAPKSDFGKAFAKARKAGLKEFDYNGRKIKVEMK